MSWCVACSDQVQVQASSPLTFSASLSSEPAQVKIAYRSLQSPGGWAARPGMVCGVRTQAGPGRAWLQPYCLSPVLPVTEWGRWQSVRHKVRHRGQTHHAREGRGQPRGGAREAHRCGPGGNSWDLRCWLPERGHRHQHSQPVQGPGSLQVGVTSRSSARPGTQRPS